MRTPASALAVAGATVSIMAVALALVPPVALAGEIYLGDIAIYDGGSATNRTTGAIGGPTCVTGAFTVPASPSPLKLSLQCEQDALIGTDVPHCDAGNCIKVLAQQLFTTSVNGSKTLTANAYNWDGGAQTTPCQVTYTGGWVAVAPWGTDGGGSTLVCHVYSRPGNE